MKGRRERKGHSVYGETASVEGSDRLSIYTAVDTDLSQVSIKMSKGSLTFSDSFRPPGGSPIGACPAVKRSPRSRIPESAPRSVILLFDPGGFLRGRFSKPRLGTRVRLVLSHSSAF
jgi:hypothetical protein